MLTVHHLFSDSLVQWSMQHFLKLWLSHPNRACSNKAMVTWFHGWWIDRCNENTPDRKIKMGIFRDKNKIRTGRLFFYFYFPDRPTGPNWLVKNPPSRESTDHGLMGIRKHKKDISGNKDSFHFSYPKVWVHIKTSWKEKNVTLLVIFSKSLTAVLESPGIPVTGSPSILKGCHNSLIDHVCTIRGAIHCYLYRWLTCYK